MTETTVASTRHTPSVSSETALGGRLSKTSARLSGASSPSRNPESIALTVFAPESVSQKTSASSRSMRGMPKRRLSTIRSMARSRACGSSGAVTQVIAISSARSTAAAVRISSSSSRVCPLCGSAYRPHRMSAGYRMGGSEQGGSVPLSTARSVFFSSFSPFFDRAAQGTTGMPSSRESAAVSMRICFFRASSIRFRQRTACGCTSSTCRTRTRLRWRQAASATRMTACAPPQVRNSRASASSCERACSE